MTQDVRPHPTGPGAGTPASLRAAVDVIERGSGLDGIGGVLGRRAERLATGRLGGVLDGRWLGHALHPLLTDIPLGCWIAAGALDVVGGRRSRRAARRLVGLGLLGVPATVASGLVDWSSVTEARTRRVGVAHALGNAAVAVLYAASWRARGRGHHLVGVAAGLAGGALAVGTGYLGGHLAFARGVGVGPRGVDDAPGTHSGSGGEAGGDDALLDPAAAMAVLGVGRDQLDAMVADDLLVVRVVQDDTPYFAEADLMAVRMVGG